MPGDSLEFRVNLVKPMPLTEQLRFVIREGNRTVGAGIIKKIIN